MANDTGGCKIDRVARERELDELDQRLLERRDAGASLRDLETYHNRKVLEAALNEAGMDTLEGEVENLYRLLTDDDVSVGTRVEARSRLERNGVDPDAVTDDFVSYQTVRTHLNDCLDVDTERTGRIDRTDAKNVVFKLLSRTESITTRTIDRLRTSGHLTIENPEVTLSLRVACTECGEEYTFTRLVDRGRCSCRTDGRTAARDDETEA